jgi:hypothetical protein
MQRIIPILLILLMFSGACIPLAQVAPTPVVIASTPMRAFIPILTSTPQILPTSTVTPTFTATITPELDHIRSTPPTLMLHRSNLQFDSVAFLKAFIEILKQNGMRIVTYRDIYKNPKITATERGKLFIITINDCTIKGPF